MGDDQSGLELTVDGREVRLPATDDTLLGVVRDQLGLVGPKDGCSPQGQCGCCTVLVDGRPRVACVTPARRVAGRSVTTIDGLDPARRAAWAAAFCATGASQCGFCTPGIVVRLDASAGEPGQGERPSGRTGDPTQPLLAHLCRCTGWQTIVEAWDLFHQREPAAVAGRVARRDLEAAGRRATIEGRSPQQVSPDVALGLGGFAADTAPADALVAVSDGAGGWVVGETLAEARAAQGKVQGRRTTVSHSWPLDVPAADDGAAGPWDVTLRTTWVEPAHLETDAAWCRPGGEPGAVAAASPPEGGPLANGGAFGAKRATPVTAAARELADRHGRPVLVLASREDATRWGPKRPPVAGGARADGTGVLRLVTNAVPGHQTTAATTDRLRRAVAAVAPGLTVETVTVPGPPTSAGIRAAGWAEAVVLLAGARGDVGTVRSPDGAEATATVDPDGTIRVGVRCGVVLDATVLRSYCIGAAHMAWSWLTSEALTVDADGAVHDLTVRSFGITRAVDTPPIVVELDDADDTEPMNGSDAVFAAVAAAGWLHLGCPRDWPTGTIGPGPAGS